MKFIDIQPQYQHLKKGIDRRIGLVLEHGQYIMGPEVFELEEQLADYVGVKHAITCANGTDALQLCLMVLGIKSGDAVFCPTFTFFATAEPIALMGATPVFVDSDEATFNICPIDLEKRIKQVISEGKVKPKAIIAVDLFGLPANYPELERIAKQYKLTLIEDAAQGFGGEIRGQAAGSFGELGTTSFFPAKPLGCYGDGGAVFTNNDEYADLLKSLRMHGKGKDKYNNVRIGMNSRLDTIQAAVLLEKLQVFPTELIRRNYIAKSYNASIGKRMLTQRVPNGYKSSWAQYSLLENNRDKLIARLNRKNLPTMTFYKTCMHQQKAFDNLIQGRCLVAERLAENIFSLPIYPFLRESDIAFVIQSVLEKVGH